MSTINEALIPYPCAPGNKPGRGRRPVGAVLHHMAGYLPGTDGIFRNPATGYATNLGIGSLDGQNYIVHEYVPEGEAAWGNGNDHLNQVAISIEHENNRAAGSASKPVHEVHELSARTLARHARQWDWRINGKLQLVLRDFPNHDFYDEVVPGFGTEFNVTGHRTVALKDCPRDLDMVWIVARANEILAGGGATEEDDMPKAKLFRSDPSRGGNGDIRIVNMETGLDHGISDVNDLDLYIRLGWFDGVTTSTPINVMPHEMIRIRLIASQARGGVSVDAAAVARELSGTVAAAVEAALAEVEFDGDAAAIAAKVDQILADDFAKVNANIDDQPTEFEIAPKE